MANIMATGFKRETMIALRATREAIQVARDVGYPQMEPPPRVEPPPFALETGWQTQPRVQTKPPPQPKLTVLAILIWIVVLTWATLVITFNWRFP